MIQPKKRRKLNKRHNKKHNAKIKDRNSQKEIKNK